MDLQGAQRDADRDVLLGQGTANAGPCWGAAMPLGVYLGT
jgi:hypothetical protein